MTQLAWIGLGNMGRGMAKNLIEKGSLSKPLLIYNRTQKRSHDLISSLSSSSSQNPKAIAVESIEDAVKKSDIVFFCLGDDDAVKESFEKALGKGVGSVQGKLFVDCSTVHPETSREVNKKVTEKGAGFVACPVFGAPAMADSGQLICVLAGPSQDVDKVKPYTTGVMGRAIIDFSNQDHGQALLLKVIGNTFVFSMVETLAEGHAVAEKSGLGTENLHKFIEIMFPGPYTAYSTRMRSGDYWKREEPLFAVDLALKDVRHAKDLAKSGDVKMGNLEVAERHLKDVKEQMGQKGDIAGIYGAVRKEANLKFEN